jgi:hypothetical protein
VVEEALLEGKEAFHSLLPPGIGGIARLLGRVGLHAQSGEARQLADFGRDVAIQRVDVQYPAWQMQCTTGGGNGKRMSM